MLNESDFYNKPATSDRKWSTVTLPKEELDRLDAWFEAMKWKRRSRSGFIRQLLTNFLDEQMGKST